MNRKQKMRGLLLTLVLGLSFNMTVAAKSVKSIERGMTKAQVTSVFGSPRTKSFDENCELWRYTKTRGGVLDLHDVYITVTFGNDGRVVRYEETENAPFSVQPGQSVPALPSMVVMPPRFDGQLAISGDNFGKLLSRLKGESFADERLKLIEVACLGCFFTCGQCADILSVFTFSGEKMSALQFMAPRLVDLQNADSIYRQFSTSWDKDKAMGVIRDANC